MNEDPAPGQSDLSPPAWTHWDSVIGSFLADKARRSGSSRAPESYASVLRQFKATCRKDPDAMLPSDVSALSAGKGESGRAPSPATVAAWTTALSPFFRYLVRSVLAQRNPCDIVARPGQTPSTPKGLSADEARRLLASVPGTPEGLRARAVLGFMLMTGGRRSEALALRAGRIEPGDTAFYTFRIKGGVRGRRELPEPALRALAEALAAAGRDISRLAHDEPVWLRDTRKHFRSRPPSGSAFHSSFRRYLARAGLHPTGSHAFRRSAPKLRRDDEATVEEAGLLLDHSSLAVASDHLRLVEGERDPDWYGVADNIGLDAALEDGANWHASRGPGEAGTRPAAAGPHAGRARHCVMPAQVDRPHCQGGEEEPPGPQASLTARFPDRRGPGGPSSKSHDSPGQGGPAGCQDRQAAVRRAAPCRSPAPPSWPAVAHGDAAARAHGFLRGRVRLAVCRARRLAAAGKYTGAARDAHASYTAGAHCVHGVMDWQCARE